MSAVLPEIHMFWHGPALSRVEQLSMQSFLAHGHRLNLYVYEQPDNVPAGVTLIDAESILERDLMFFHRRTGSVALFADWFRYRLLHARGGIWADADIVCLRAFDFERPEVFGWQDSKLINIAVLGLPAGDELAAWMAESCRDPNRPLPYDTLSLRLRKLRRRYLGGNRRERTRWGEYGPRGFTYAAKHLGYAEKALPVAAFYPVPFPEWQRMFVASDADDGDPIDLTNSYAAHLWANKMRELPGFDKNGSFPRDSLFERWWADYFTSAA